MLHDHDFCKLFLFRKRSVTGQEKILQLRLKKLAKPDKKHWKRYEVRIFRYAGTVYVVFIWC